MGRPQCWVEAAALLLLAEVTVALLLLRPLLQQLAGAPYSLLGSESSKQPAAVQVLWNGSLGVQAGRPAHHQRHFLPGQCQALHTPVCMKQEVLAHQQQQQLARVM